MTNPVERAIVWKNFDTLKRLILAVPGYLSQCGESGYYPLDVAIMCGRLEMARYLCGMGGRPNLDIYCDGKFTPVHEAAYYGHTETLKWVFTENVLPLNVLNIKDHIGNTPLDCAIARFCVIAHLDHIFRTRKRETVALLRRFQMHSVFLAMHRAKRDHRQCVLRRLPNELLDMVVEEVAAHFDLVVVVWKC